MRVKVLASGSKGNSTIVLSDNTKILIDAGIGLQQIKYALDMEEIDISSINAVLVTHTHSDHIKGLASIVKKYHLKVYASIDSVIELSKNIPIESIVVIEDTFNINDIEITPLEVSHDVSCYGFIIECSNQSIVYITDTGYINKKYYDITKNRNIYIIESNHDEQMLMNGPYPYHLKQRVIGDKGHMSNHYAGKYLAKVIGDNTKYVFLAHISENNNTYELALEQVKEELSLITFDNNNIIVTHQNESSRMVEV